VKKQLKMATQLRNASDRQTSPEDLNLLREAATALEENAHILELCSHTECPEGLGLGGTLAWHREKINKLRHRPLAALPLPTHTVTLADSKTT
jgi:hypothetical protein